MQMPESPFLAMPGMPYGETGELPAPEMSMQDPMSSEPATLEALREWIRRIRSQMEQEMLAIEQKIEEVRDRSPVSIPVPTDQTMPRAPLAPPDLMSNNASYRNQ